MEPTKTNFKSPTLDFFPPLKNIPKNSPLLEFSLIGLKLKNNGLYLLSKEYPFMRNEIVHITEIPRGVISLIYENDIGGLSFKFNKKVLYFSNGGGHINLEIEGLKNPYIFAYDMVARVRDKKEIVWENRDLEKILKLKQD